MSECFFQKRGTMGYIERAAIKHAEKRGPIQVSDISVAMDMRCAAFFSPKHLGKFIHTDLKT